MHTLNVMKTFNWQCIRMQIACEFNKVFSTIHFIQICFIQNLFRLRFTLILGNVRQKWDKEINIVKEEISSKYSHFHFRFPENRNEISMVKRNFYINCHLPNVVGAIDGTLIPIIAPTTDEHVYVCRKGYHAINCQAVVDTNMR